MLSIASRDGPSDEELIREIRHMADQIIPEVIRRFDTNGAQAVEDAVAERDERIAQLESDLAEARTRISDLEEQTARLESDLALIS